MNNELEISAADMAAPRRGFVVWFNDAKGFGFVRDEQGRDWFVHYSTIAKEGFRTLAEGEAVRFTLQRNHLGYQTAQVWPGE